MINRIIYTVYPTTTWGNLGYTNTVRKGQAEVKRPHLLHDGGQSAEGQATLVAPGYHGAAQLHHDPLGLPELPSVGQGATVNSP